MEDPLLIEAATRSEVLDTVRRDDVLIGLLPCEMTSDAGDSGSPILAAVGSTDLLQRSDDARIFPLIASLLARGVPAYRLSM
jgi:hypothetical protein